MDATPLVFNQDLVNYASDCVSKYERVMINNHVLDYLVQNNLAPECTTFKELLNRIEFENELVSNNHKFQVKRVFPNHRGTVEIASLGRKSDSLSPDPPGQP